MKIKKPNFWDLKKPNFISYLLLPFTLPIYIKNKFHRNYQIEKNGLKKICVGNIYVGGTGKTPLSIMISEIFKNRNSAVIKKFYKDHIDEHKLIEKYTKLITKRNRHEALKEAKEQKLNYVIFDDGLQDHSMKYDLRIVCFNNNQWIGNGLLIPAGPLRENIYSLKKYDAVVLNGDRSKNDSIINQIKKINDNINIFESYYEPTNIDELNKKKAFVVFSGIGNNKNFINLLKIENINVCKEFNFPDHYKLSKSDFVNIMNFAAKNNADILTTEKDFMRLNNEFQKKVKYLKIKIKFYDFKKFYEFITSV